MATRTKKVPTRKGTRTAGGKEAILIAANKHIVRHYPFGCLGSTPKKLSLAERQLWIVPVVLTSPGSGAVGVVGMVAVDPATRELLGSTKRSEVIQAVKRLREENRDALEATFHRARTV